MSGYGAPPRAVVITRATEYAELLARHGTRGQVEFFLKTRGQKIDEVVARHHTHEAVVDEAMAAIPKEWRRAKVSRRDLSRYVFGPTDIIIAVGQDGLVANVAKYLDAQPVIGVNPDPARFDGVLVQHTVGSLPGLLGFVDTGRYACEERAMVEATLSDGQRLTALNEIFLGRRTHQSARYLIQRGDASEHQSSSGLIVTTGTGATGWARSISRERRECSPLPCSPQARSLTFFVREAFPSVSTGCALTQGVLADGDALIVRSEMNDDGVLFGDGIEDDRVAFPFGAEVRLSLANRGLRLIPRAKVKPRQALARASRSAMSGMT